MASARMFAFDLGPCLARFLDDQVRRVPFHHRFDIGPLVAWNHDEAGDVARDPIILGRRKLDLLDTSLIAALTVERQRLLDAVLFSTFINPLINPAKQLLVLCRSVREAHQAILPQYEQEGNRGWKREPQRKTGAL